MRRLIDANALSEKIGNMKFEITRNRGGYKYCNEDEKNEWDKLDSFDSLVCDAPTVDAVEVVHGKWTPMEVIAKKAGYGVRYYRHAECEVNPCRLFESMSDYCPNCGAKMDGGNEDA